MNTNAPIDNYDKTDPGDDVIEAFRYQFAYAVVLLCQGYTEGLDIQTIWCEQEEDILTQSKTGKFTYYQIKKRKKELGYWTLSDEALIKSIGRFVKHEERFSAISESYNFVSNCEYKEYGGEKVNEAANSPINLFKKISQSPSIQDIELAYYSKLVKISEDIECDIEDLFKTLKKIKLLSGPAYESFDSELSTIHLSKINNFSNLPLHEIHRIRDGLIYRAFDASSKKIDAPEAHLMSILDSNCNDPRIEAKKLVPSLIDEIEQNILDVRFTYNSGFSTLNLGNASNNMIRLGKKLEKGNLSQHEMILQRQSLSAERHLLEAMAKNESKFEMAIESVENYVLDVCSNSLIMAVNDDNCINGRKAFQEMIKRFEKSGKVDQTGLTPQSDSFFRGVAGLLAGECKVWWSEDFDVDGDE